MFAELIFSSHYSMGRSILTVENGDIESFDPTQPVSILDICKKYQIDTFNLLEDNFSSFFKAYTLSKKNGLSLRYGINFTICEDTLNESDTNNSIISLWIKNTQGYFDLLKIYALANKENWTKKFDARLSWKLLRDNWSDNLLLTIPFYSGFIKQNLIDGKTCYPSYLNEFDPIFFIHNQGLPFDQFLAEHIVNYCKQHTYRYINGHSCYYYANKHVKALQVFRCIQKRSTFEKPELTHFCSDKFSFESYIFNSRHEEEIEDNDKKDIFAQSFNDLDIPRLNYGVRLPEISIKTDKVEYLKNLTRAGYKEAVASGKIPQDKINEYVERIKHELAIFEDLHLVDYILLIHDIIKHAKDEGIPVGPGRGSSAGSLIFYLIGCTDIDPIVHNLFFSRFISEARAQSHVIDGITYLNGKSMPDVDTDISFSNRTKVIDYLNNKHKGKTSKISTVNTLTGKLIIKEVTKILLGYSEDQTKRIADMVERIFGVVQPLREVYEETKRFKEWVDEDVSHKDCFDVCLLLEGLIKNKGQHAAGVAVSYEDIDSLVPIERSSDGIDLVTAFEMKDVANLLVKVDLLGLRNLDVSYNAAKAIGISISDIDINNPSIYNYFQHFDEYHGLFQIEKGMGQNTVMSVRPKNFRQLMACIAIGRPGAYKYIPDFIEYLKTGKRNSYGAEIDKELEDTGGIIIYQEQITSICKNVLKMTEIEADTVRYCIGKKLRAEIAKLEPFILQKAKEQGINEENITKFWNTCNASADYLFSANHCCAYASITAINTYLKANHPIEFYTSLLQMSKHESKPVEEVKTIYREMAKKGIKLLPPSILSKELDFHISDNSIRFGVGAIKGMAEQASKKIGSFNKENLNKFELFKSCQDAKLPLNVVEPLILSGAFDNYNDNRANLLLEYQTYNILSAREVVLVQKFGEKHNYDLFSVMRWLRTNKCDKGKMYISESRFNTIKKKFLPYKLSYDFNAKNPELSTYFNELKLLGFSYSYKLLEVFKNTYPEVISTSDLVNNIEDGQFSRFLGIVSEVKTGISRNKNAYVRLTLDDELASFNVMAMKDKIADLKDEKGELISEGMVVYCEGKKSGDIVFLERVAPQWDIYEITKGLNLRKNARNAGSEGINDAQNIEQEEVGTKND